MKPKRVLIFSLAYYPDLVGGAEVAVKEITDRIDPGLAEFHMLTMKTREGQLSSEKIGNIFVHRFGFFMGSPLGLRISKYFFLLFSPFRASLLHKEFRFDAIWAIMAYVAGFPALFFKLFHTDVPFMLTLQEGDPIEYILAKARPVSRIFRMIFRSADKIQAISKFLGDFGVSMGAKTEPLVIPNGVDVAAFSKEISEGELSRIHKEIAKNKGDAFIVSASRLVQKNGLEYLVAALPHLSANVKLLLLGSGELEVELKAQAASLGLSERVVFKGYVSHEELPKYLKACDIFARPSLSEGLGNSFLEAMAAGLPVIATPVGGIVDFVKNKETGLFCVPKDATDVARKAEIYLRDSSLRNEIVDNAFRMVKERYDWNNIAREMGEKVFGILMP